MVGWTSLGNYYQLFVRLGCHRITRCSPGMRLILSHIWSLYRQMCFFDLLKLPQLNWIMMVKVYTIGNPYTHAYIYIYICCGCFFLKGKKSFISRYVQVFRRFSLCLTSGSHEVLVYTTMISACARRGETAEAEEWLWEMHRLDARSGTTGRTRWITWL